MLNQAVDVSEFGTFKDNLKAPVHRWFKYPAGFSYKLVDQLIDHFGLTGDSLVLDMFLGSGTTTLACKARGVPSVGVEAHPFVFWVAKTKHQWDLNITDLYDQLCHIVTAAQKQPETDPEMPELVHKCYSPNNLRVLVNIKNVVATLPDERHRDFFNLALTDTLRNASSAGTGWPYIAPANTFHGKKEKPALDVFEKTARLMIDDLGEVQKLPGADCRLILGDARNPYDGVAPQSADLAVTSPPYLNNYDYADRTRLEMYFFGWAKTWGEITHNVRDRLITAATTQVRRKEMDLDPLVREADAGAADEISGYVGQLSAVRRTKGGKKSYDLMVAGYFNDMTRVLRQTANTLKSGAALVMVLGDSAPYGVYIPSDELLGRLGLGLGFHRYETIPLRKRGEKWKTNKGRHQVALKECLLVLWRE